jgi:tRNA1Val (adenine37-N6)-methyltransferase
MSWQPASGYRAGIDPVFLAAACPRRRGSRCLSSAAEWVWPLCLAARVPGLSITGVERQADYADLARRNAEAANAGFEIVTADLAALPPALRQRAFDQVIANPPYYRAGAGTAAEDAGREAALREKTSAVGLGFGRLRPVEARGLADDDPDGGASARDARRARRARFDICAAAPVPPRSRAAGRVILRARKGGRAPFRLLAPLLLHEDARHQDDGESYTAEIAGILRGGEAIRWP